MSERKRKTPWTPESVTYEISTREPCGCLHSAKSLRYCPTHTAAPEMAVLLSKVIACADSGLIFITGAHAANTVDAVRVLLARIGEP